MDFWGLRRQLRMTQEECGELIIAISHFIRGRKNSIDNLIEELADTQLMLNQIIHHVGEDKVKAIIDIKSDYVKRKLEEAKEKANGI
jgi:NTP pyrophosphatase (non-canonical NTP hydrolase)